MADTRFTGPAAWASTIANRAWRSASAQHLVLSAADPIEPRIPRVFIPVKWGRRTYLIPPEELEKFSEAIIKGDEPRNEGAAGEFYVVGLAESVGGVPELPEPWATFLRKNAIIGTVVEVRSAVESSSTWDRLMA